MLRPSIPCADAIAALASFDTVIDVRSPGEYALDHIPGAINCPVLNDDERKRIGTMNKVDSTFAAKRSGAALIARNIASLLEERFADRPRQWRPLVYCWRGGQRSGALTHVLSSVGWPARSLEGGYRAYRRYVVEQLTQLPTRFDLRIVCGPTGSGKSRLLRHLQHAGAQIIDLEDLAQHRGSVLGALPSALQPSQKLFETKVWWTLRGLDPARPVYVESESRKVGQLRLPDALIEHMRAAPCVRIELPLAERVRLLREEYAHFEADMPSLLRQLDCLVSLHGRDLVEGWKRMAAEHRWEAMVERLLEEHYDPAYRRSINGNFAQAGHASVLSLATSEDAAFADAACALVAQ